MDGPPDQRTAHVSRPQYASDARAATMEFLEELRPAVSAHTADSLLLLVSELVANALRHGGGITALRLSAGHDTLDIGVEDPSSMLPQIRPPDLTGRTGGFGWPMIQQLADAVAAHPVEGGGKEIRVSLSR
ncbi:hypothetical protein B1H18_00075 [Streptomyces tsukubensis]|uniref:Histidine kinase/HSP90-like ATPase domain-containing protein n=1 Tax=Streptomyces tsukubensis TaxID=83656 RepID=A0A1V4AG13_9ACTN|nr:hypothetical protein B1H18_00075 [Streptomyces tsukubensis]